MLIIHKKRKIYEIPDVHKELEEMTEDEQEMMQKPLHQREIWELKRLIRVSFKCNQLAPESLENSYKLG